jgi:putative component of toxin-antitoxin plasmid stabilization module
MPQTQVFLYKESDGKVPVLDWMKELRRKDVAGYAICLARARMLAAIGHELRRPHADYLRDGIYELRAKRGRVNYRILFFYHGRNVALLSNGFVKEREVPEIEIERAIQRKRRYEQNPTLHRATEIRQDTRDL